MEKLLERINALSHKAKIEDLTEGEVAEQKELRAEYIKLFRAGLRQQLDNTQIKELDGTITPLKRKK